MEFLKHVQKSEKILIGLFILFIFVGGFQVGKSFSIEKKAEQNQIQSAALSKTLDFDILSDVWGLINTEYVDLEHLDKEKASYGLAKGLVESLDDPYSAFLTPEETQIFNSDLDQELEGIGAEITKKDGAITVVSPLKGSPAEKAGLKPGDIILAINQEEILDIDVYQAIQKIRGEKGTPVTLTIFRENTEEPFDVIINRDKITFESVTTKELENEIFYISLNQFSNDSTSEFFKAASEALLSSPKGLVLDLRYNGGGYLEIAVDILGEFLPKGSTAVIVEAGADKSREIYRTDGPQRLSEIPTVVLINKGSASASEILAGALQDNQKAYVIGQKSFGKGTVQQIQPFKDGSSLRLTIAKWFTPTGKTIDKEGITPDLVVENNQTEDLQLRAAEKYLTETYLSSL
jgi:carboxyl-terminal processing protease